MVKHVFVGFLCIHLAFLVEAMVLVEGLDFLFIRIFWWRLWLRAVSGGGCGFGFLDLLLVLMVVDSKFSFGVGGARFGCMGFIFFYVESCR